MDKKPKQDISYYLLAILGLLLIILPFFFLELNGQSAGKNMVRLSLHAAAFATAVVSAGALSTVVVKAMNNPSFVKFGSWTVGAVTATAVTISTLNMSTAPSISNLAVVADSVQTDSSTVATVDSSLPENSVDSVAKEDGTLTSESEAPATTTVTATEQPKASFVKTEKETVKEKEKEVATGDKKECRDEDVGIFLSGQKVNLKEGFSFGNRSKNIRIGDECGCTASNAKVTVVDATGKSKAEKTITSPFFSLQSVTSLEPTDKVTAEVSSLKCVNKEGIASLKKIKTLFINLIFKNDGTETIRKRTAKELQKQEETTPVKKDKVEEEALKYGN